MPSVAIPAPCRRHLGRLLAAGVGVFALVVVSAVAWGEARLPRKGLPEAQRIARGPLSKEDLREFFARKGLTPANYIEGDRLGALLKNDVKITYTIDLRLQRAMERYFQSRGVQYGAFVAVEPSTGRVLALVSHTRRRRDASRPAALRASFPAASIFKIVTVAAALQEEKVTPQTVVRFRGGYWTMNRSVLSDNPRRDRRRLTVEDALALSCNHCFGKVATRWVGTRALQSYARAFGFNAPFEFELPVEESRASIPSDRYQLARTGAGFGKVYFSPLHAALVAAALANDGRMMEPSVVEKIEDRNGRLLYLPERRVIATPVKPGVARQINRMMAKTIVKGTARRAFAGFSRSHPALEVAGKTGSLRGSDPPGYNYWFVGSAPIDRPTIAVAALVTSRAGVRVKGNHVARRAFDTYFSP
jgi:cell division protein FtsI/penicillin-binding protein 2